MDQDRSARQELASPLDVDACGTYWCLTAASNACSRTPTFAGWMGTPTSGDTVDHGLYYIAVVTALTAEMARMMRRVAG